MVEDGRVECLRWGGCYGGRDPVAAVQGCKRTAAGRCDSEPHRPSIVTEYCTRGLQRKTALKVGMSMILEGGTSKLCDGFGTPMQ